MNAGFYFEKDLYKVIFSFTSSARARDEAEAKVDWGEKTPRPMGSL